MSSLGLLEAKIIPKLRTTGNYCHDRFFFCGCGGGKVVSGGFGVLALGMDFREVMLTSPPDLAHCEGVGV